MVNKKDFKIMLIAPRTTSFGKTTVVKCIPPLGLAYIAAVLEKDGFDAKILDATVEGYENKIIEKDYLTYGLSLDDIKKRIREYNPRVVGVNFSFSNQIKNVHDIFKIVKEIDKNIITIVGGPHPTYLPEKTLKDKNIDYIFLGESEYSIREFMNKLVRGKKFYDIDGFVYRDKRKIVINPKTSLIENLDELPFPARHLLSMEKYFKLNLTQQLYTKGKRVSQIITSRGCSAKCIFCTTTNFWGNRYRMRSAKNVLDEIEFLIKKYNIDEINFTDDNLTLDRERAMEIFQGMINRKFNVPWAMPQGVALWVLDEDMLKKMKESGCYSLIFAVESGNQEVLHKIIKKPLNLKKVKPLVNMAHNLDIKVYAFFVIGLPGETLDNIKETFKFARQMSFDGVDFNIATPLPGSELYEICKNNNYLISGFDFDNLMYHKGTITTSDFNAEELTKLMEKEMIKYHIFILLKSPIFFLKKYGKLFLENPSVVLKRFMNQKLYYKLFGN